MFAKNMEFAPPASPLGNTMADGLAALLPSLTLVVDSPTPVADVPASVGDSTPSDQQVVTLAPSVDVAKPVSHSGGNKGKIRPGRAPKHAKPGAQLAQKPVAASQQKVAEKPAPAPKAAPVVDLNPHLAVEELLELPGEELVRETRRLIANGLTPAFSFELRGRQTALAMSVAPVGDVIRLTVEGGRGGLIQGFPKGTSFSLEEIRGPIYGSDIGRLNLVANFRGALMDLLLQARQSA